jgi:transposase
LGGNRMSSSGSKRRPQVFFVHKPRGQFHSRVQAVGPEHFGIVCVDCAKARSKFMVVDFFGNVLVNPTILEHGHSQLEAARQRIEEACRQHAIQDRLIAIERTGEYHRPVQRFFRQQHWDIRLVHPYASRQYRQPADPGNKTDDTDLAGIFRATVNGFGLSEVPWPDAYRILQLLTRQRRDLVRKDTTLQCQIREVLHAAMPGYAECFPRFWESTVLLPIARYTGSAQAVRDAGQAGLLAFLQQAKLRAAPATLPRILAWAENAPPASLDTLCLRQCLGALDDDRIAKNQHIQAVERDIASWLAQLPYLLLLAIPGINVVSAADRAGELGPPNTYAHANAITGRAGLMPSRYQSDRVDHANGPLRRAANRRLRFALLQIADNLMRHNHHYNVQALKYAQAGKDPRWVHVRIAKQFSRLGFAMLTTGRVFRHPCCQPESSILEKLLDFHRDHGTPWPQVQRDLDAATQQLPRSRYAGEAQTLSQRLEALQRRRRGPQPLGDILALVLAKLGVPTLQSSPEEDLG